MLPASTGRGRRSRREARDVGRSYGTVVAGRSADRRGDRMPCAGQGRTSMCSWGCST